MSYFKVGDKVRCINRQTANGEQIYVGYVGTITHVASDGAIVVDNMFGSNGNAVCCSEAFEKIKEEPKQMFNIKTDPWFIRVNSEQEFEAIQDWLEENYGCSLITSYNTAFEYLTNTSSDGQVMEAFVMQGRGNPLKTPSRKEIKLTFKTTVDSIQSPEMETEQEIKMKQLQETIDKAARELKELREMGEKK